MEGMLMRDSLPRDDISKDETESFDKESIFSYEDNFDIWLSFFPTWTFQKKQLNIGSPYLFSARPLI